MGKYVLKAHDFYFNRISEIRTKVMSLYKELSKEEFIKHELVKFAKRVREADTNIIPADPTLENYRLSGELRRYRRYKTGLQRYRLFFCFSNSPTIIAYLYLNDEKTKRKAGHKTDPYEIFKKLVSQNKVSSDPSDDRMKKFIRNYH